MPIGRIVLSLLAVGAAAAVPTTAALAGGGARLHIDRATMPVRLESTGTLPQLSNAAPGDHAGSLFGVRNSGSEAGELVLALAGHGSLDARRALTVRVERLGHVYFQGALDRVGRVRLGLLGAGETRRYRITVTLRSDTAEQGLHATLGARWLAVQSAQA